MEESLIYVMEPDTILKNRQSRKSPAGSSKGSFFNNLKMKGGLSILIFSFICTSAMDTIKAQSYDPLAVQRVNDLIANNGLNATPDLPSSWEFATWNSESPKQLTELWINGMNLTGEASLAELTSLQRLYTYDNSLTKLDVTNCTGLTFLNCSNNIFDLTELNITNCIALQEIDCQNNSLTELDVKNLTKLQTLSCNWNNLIKLDITNCIGLQLLGCIENNLTELDVSTCTELRFLDFTRNSLTKLDITNCTGLEVLGCAENNLTELDVVNFTELTALDCAYNNLSKLDITNCTGLEHLFCEYNNLTGLLDVSDFTLLKYLYCFNNSLTWLDITNCTALQELQCNNNSLTELDLTGLNDLWDFNGNDQNVHLTFFKSEDGDYICPVSLNSPEFGDASISYSEGILKSADNTVASTSFQVQTNIEGRVLKGIMNFDYSELVIYSVKVDVNNSEYGEASGDGMYEYNETATVTAVAFEGYEFVNWTKNGTVISTDNSYSFTVTENVELVANFEENTDIETVDPFAVRIYPNPATNQLKIKNYGLEIENIKVFDVTGRMVMSVKMQDIESLQNGTAAIDISHLLNGIYFLHIQTEQGTVTKKVVKN